MTIPTTFDLVVIGTGVAGAAVAHNCRAGGLSVAIIDSRPYGGTCAQRGCDPKKVLVGVAEAADAARRLTGKGVRAESLSIDWPALMRFKRTFTDPVPEDTEQGFTEAGIDTFHGRARFIDRSSVQVGEHLLEGRHVVIASGAVPTELGIPGEEHLTTSDAFLELEALPARIVFLGSGFISFEFAHLAATAGAQVTMLEMTDQPLAGFDRDLVSTLVERTRRMGIDLHLKRRVDAVDRTGDHLVVRTEGDGGERSFECDMVVHGAGRVPDLDDLDLADADVEREKHGVRVNEHLQSVSNPSVYAAGDAAASGPMLSPVGSYEGSTVAENILGGNARTVDYRAVPSVVYTLPPLASVGLQEQEAAEASGEVRTNFQHTGDWYSSRRVGEEHSAHKVLVDTQSDEILGAHLLGPNADELVNVFALAIRTRMTSRELSDVLFAYPTRASDVAHMLRGDR